ncbi:MAG: kelch repeat-containing protein [Candidatus Hatepunaea meridiana]|nr:kelch repeat-containing protein [Candidatus Hatepunaea meridiana]
MKRIWFTILLLLSLPFTVHSELIWQETTPMHHCRIGHAAAVSEGRIFVFGGMQNERRQILSSVEVYIPGDGQRGDWREVASIPEPLYKPAAVAFGRHIYLIGGLTTNYELNNRVYLYDSVEDSFRVVGRMPEPYLYGHAAVRVERRILVIGGMVDEGDYHSEGKWLTPGNMAWEDGPELINPRAHFGLTERNGDVYAIGGLFFGPVNRMEMLSSGRWIARAPLPTARGGLGASFLNDTLIVTVGGITPRGIPTNAVEGYNTQTDEWTRELPDMITPRRDFVLVELLGKLYAIGGRGNTRDRAIPLNSVEVFFDDENSISDNREALQQTQLLTVSPNPANGPVSFLFPSIQGVLKLYTLNSRLIAKVPVSAQGGSWIWDCNNYPAGLYLYRYIPVTGDKSYPGQITVIK